MEPMKPMKPMKPMAPMAPMKPAQSEPAWWPANLGTPSSSGSQDGSRYAVFDQAQRLVVETSGTVTTYDTGDRRIHGVGQRQGSGKAMTFETDKGPLTLSELKAL